MSIDSPLFSVNTSAAPVGGDPWVLNDGNPIADAAQFAVVVDTDDNDTVKDLVQHSIALDPAVTVGQSGAFRSMTGLKHFTSPGALPGVTFDAANNADKPDMFFVSGSVRTYFFQYDGIIGVNGGQKLLSNIQQDLYINRVSGGGMNIYSAAQNRSLGTQVLPTDGTKFSVAVVIGAGFATKMYYATSTETIVLHATAGSTHSATRPAAVAGYIACDASGDGIQARHNIVAGFDGELSLAQIQALHDNWKNELVAASGPVAGNVLTALIHEAMSTSAGIQTFSNAAFSSGAESPKAVLYSGNLGVANKTYVNDLQRCIGATDGVFAFGTAVRSEHNSSFSSDVDGVAFNYDGTTKVVYGQIDRAVDSTYDVRSDIPATGDFLTTDGIRLDNSTAPPVAAPLGALLIGGSGVVAEAGRVVCNQSSVDTAITVNLTMTQTPDLILFFNDRGDFDGSRGPDSASCFGAAANTAGGIKQAFALMGGKNSSTPFSWAYISDTRCSMFSGTAPSVGNTLEVTDISAGSFEITKRDNISNTFLGYVAIYLDGSKANVVPFDTPTTAASDWTVTGAGFTPQACFYTISGATAYNTMYNQSSQSNGGVESSVICHGAFTADDEYSQAVYDEDAATGNANAGQCNSSQAFYMEDYAGNVEIDASGPVFNSDGFTVSAANITEVSGTARKGFAVFIEY